LRLPDFKTIGT